MTLRAILGHSRLSGLLALTINGDTLEMYSKWDEYGRFTATVICTTIAHVKPSLSSE